MLSPLLLSTFLTLSMNAVPASATGQAAGQYAPATTMDDGIVLQQQSGGEPVCLKLRVYWFARNDGEAPRFVRETTCSTARPQLHKASKFPKARLIPAK